LRILTNSPLPHNIKHVLHRKNILLFTFKLGLKPSLYKISEKVDGRELVDDGSKYSHISNLLSMAKIPYGQFSTFRLDEAFLVVGPIKLNTFTCIRFLPERNHKS
jgi:hypothetical protein